MNKCALLLFLGLIGFSSNFIRAMKRLEPDYPSVQELDKKFYKIKLVAKLLIKCALEGDVAYFKSIPLSKELINGLNLLSCAAAGGSVTLVKLFVTKGNATVNLKDDSGATALHIAAANNRIAVARFLVKEAGADLNILTKEQLTPFGESIVADCVEMVQFFIEECGVSCKNLDEYKADALHIAAGAGVCKVARFLIDNKLCSVDDQDTLQNTPLHYSAYSNKLEMIKLLLLSNAVAHKRNKYGYKPLCKLTAKERRKLLGMQQNN